MFAIDVLSRLVHVLTAITLVGGSLFSLWVLLPSVAKLDEGSRAGLIEGISSRWRRFVHGGVALFLISGFYNYFRAMPLHKGDGLYHMLVGTKMVLALGVFFIAAALVGRSPRLAGIRENRRWWLTILVSLSVLIVAFSSFLKVRGY